MLNWLKKKTRFIFNSNYVNNIDCNTGSQKEMYLTEQNMYNQEESIPQPIKLFIYDESGNEYILDIPQEMSLEKIMMMSVAHFYTPFAAMGEETQYSDYNSLSHQENYRLVLVRNMKTLDINNSIASEEIINCDELLLIKCRKDIIKTNLLTQNLEDIDITIDQINQETKNIISLNSDREANPINTKLDFKIAFRQILLTLIEISIHLIALEDNAADLFMTVFEHLDKRHKPKVDKGFLKQLMDMGFTEVRAIKALQLKKSVVEAMEWLLDESSHEHSSEIDSEILLLTAEERKIYFLSDKDPAIKVMQEFNKYIEKWFIPDSRAFQNLTSLGYGEDLAKEALRVSCNNETIAQEFLDGKSRLIEISQKGFHRNSPVMSAILESPFVQISLSKPKTLFALMMLCDSPNNINVWLSDPEAHPVVSQILRIYHAEKHRLGHEIPEDLANTDVDMSIDSIESYKINCELLNTSLMANNKYIANIPSMPKNTSLHFNSL